MRHAQWVKDDGPSKKELIDDPRRANLCEANLNGLNLTNAELSGVHLEGALLAGAILKGAILKGAHLEGAQLEGANLEGAHLVGAHLERAMLISAANLKDADLSEADLMGAWLIGANLESAQLFGAHLEKAFLVAAHLKGAIVYLAYLDQARLDGADVGGADFDLIPDSLPEVFGLYTTQNLDLVKFSYQPAGLVKLRSKCKELGLRTAENQLTCAIRRSELSREDSYTRLQVHSRFERGINYVLFDLTCQYGLSPSRPLIIVGLLAVLFAVVYVLAQSSPGRHGGIWVVWDEHLVDRKEGSGVPQRLTNGFPTTQYRGRMRRFFSVVGLAAYFSLLSALRIGWHELNVGTWITRLQPREYLLRASGWVRIVSGLQSLISVYMVALAILTYFGTPF